MPAASAGSARACGAARSEGAAERARSGATTTELLKSMGGSVREMMRRSSQPNLYGCGPRLQALTLTSTGAGPAAPPPTPVMRAWAARRAVRAPPWHLAARPRACSGTRPAALVGERSHLRQHREPERNVQPVTPAMRAPGDAWRKREVGEAGPSAACRASSWLLPRSGIDTLVPQLQAAAVPRRQRGLGGPERARRPVRQAEQHRRHRRLLARLAPRRRLRRRRQPQARAPPPMHSATLRR